MKPLIIILGKDLSGSGWDKLPKSLTEEYHILMIQDPERKLVDVKVFSDKNIRPIDLDSLKKLCKINGHC